MDFSDALRHLKQGHMVQRHGWNGKNMFIYLIPGSEFAVSEGTPLAKIFPTGTMVGYHGHIDMKCVDGTLVPWLASQTDILADDWQVLYELPHSG